MASSHISIFKLHTVSQPLTPLRIQPTPYPSQNTANPLPLSEYSQPLTPLRIQTTPYPSQNTANPLPLSEYSQPLTPLRVQPTPYPSQNTDNPLPLSEYSRAEVEGAARLCNFVRVFFPATCRITCANTLAKADFFFWGGGGGGKRGNCPPPQPFCQNLDRQYYVSIVFFLF